MAKQNKEKRVRVLPLKGVGGIGNAGDTAWLPKAEAEHWVEEGYVEILPDADEPVPSSVAGEDEDAEEQLELTPENPPSPPDASSTADASAQSEEVEDHKIMKPETKRGK